MLADPNDPNSVYFPTPGETFEVMTFASATGKFATLAGDVGLLDSTTALVPVYSATDFTLVAAIAGDINLDGVVNGLDANLVSMNFLSGGQVYADGDANFDGTVDGLGREPDLGKLFAGESGQRRSGAGGRVVGAWGIVGCVRLAAGEGGSPLSGESAGAAIENTLRTDGVRT